MGLLKALFGSSESGEEESRRAEVDDPQKRQAHGEHGMGSGEQAAERPAEFDWQRSPPHLFLLTMFLGARTMESITQPGWGERWHEALGEEPHAAIERFLHQGMIEPAGLKARIAHEYTVADLKPMLRQRGLRVSGRKAVLIQRLMEADPESMEQAVSDASVFECSVEGHEIAKEYEAREDEKRSRMEDQTWKALGQHRFKEASETVASFNAHRVFPRGVDTEQKTRILEVMFAARPEIVDPIEDDALQYLRMAAGMTVLWGTNRPQDWLPTEFESDLELDSATAARMLIFYAQNTIDLERYRKSNAVADVEVLTANDACSACQTLAGEYSFDEVPVLPNPDCTHKKGCRCTYAPVTKSWD